MKNSLFREKSINKMSSPENLNGYLHVTSIPIWIALIGVIVIMSGLLIWSNYAVINSYSYGVATVKDGVVTGVFEDRSTSNKIKVGMDIEILGVLGEVMNVSNDLEGNTIVSGTIEVPDGEYEAKVLYDHIQMISLLFN